MFCDKLKEIVSELQAGRPVETLTVRDMNINVAHPWDRNVKIYLDPLQRLDLLNMIKIFTYINPVHLSTSIMDHFVTTGLHRYECHSTIPIRFVRSLSYIWLHKKT